VVIAAQSQEIFLPRICLSLFRLGVMFFLGVPGIESGCRNNQLVLFFGDGKKRHGKELLQLLNYKKILHSPWNDHPVIFLFLEQLHFKNSRMIMAAAACDPRPIKNMWRHLLKKPALAAMLL
jgi:hypothetical protein